MTVLSDASDAIHGPRTESYGPPEDGLARVASVWSEWLCSRFDIDVELTGRDVCILNVLEKAFRDAVEPRHDNLVDIAGYAECASLCTDLEPRSFISHMEMHSVDAPPEPA